MSKERGEYELPGQGLKSRNTRQTLNGVRRLAGNNPIADVLEFRKEYTVVDLSSQRSGSAAAASDQAGHSAESQRPVHGPRPAWSRSGEFKLRYGRQNGELNPGAWPERDSTATGGEKDRLPVLTMKETIQAARAFFNPTAVEDAGGDETSSDSAAATVDIGDHKQERATGTGQVPAVRKTGASALAVSPAEGKNAQAAGGETEAAEELLDEIACEIVEDALVSYEDEEGGPDLPDAADDDDGYAPLLFLREEDEADGPNDGEVESVLLFDDFDESVSDPEPDSDDATAMAEAPVATAGGAGTGSDATADSATAPRRRRPGPRLPIGDMASSRGAISDEETTSRGRARDMPKWSASARHHMSDMLASAPAETSRAGLGRPRVELPRIDSRPERHRQSSAMILLGLPVMLLAGFGAAYVYHASNYDPGRVLQQAQKALPASIAPVPTIAATKTPTKISESIIQKQESDATAAPSEEVLPPPVAPPVAAESPQSTGPAAPAASPVGAKQTASVGSETTDAPDVAAEAAPPPARIEPAAAPVTSAISIVPAQLSEAEVSLPQAVAPDAAVESGEETAAANPSAASTEIGDTAQQPAQPEAEAVETAQADTDSSQTQLAAIDPSAKAPPEEVSENGKLIVRGNKRLMIGDIAAARLLFELAAESGNAAAATAMGHSYDPVYFARIGVRGVKPDAETARSWYEKAVAAGDATAKEDLRNLTSWVQSQQ